MLLTKKDLNHILKLAHFEIPESEKEEYLGQLAKILDYMKILDQLDLAKIEPTSENMAYRQGSREDEVRQYEELDLAIMAPDFTENAFQVPKILGGEE